jgi:hypothetical protein
MFFSTYCGGNPRRDISNSYKIPCVCVCVCVCVSVRVSLPACCAWHLCCIQSASSLSLLHAMVHRDHVALGIVYFLCGFKYGSWDSLVIMAMGYGLDGWGSVIQPPTQWALGAISLRVKWSGCKADHSPPPSVEVKNGGAILIPPLPCTSSWHGTQLIKQRSNFTSALWFQIHKRSHTRM